MSKWWSPARNVEDAVRQITDYLEDTSSRAYKYNAIYLDGLGASAVLRAIAQDPPRSLREKFDRIIDIDCSRWKSPRALQRAIAKELKLPECVLAVFDRQDEEDDFNGVDEGSREVIAEVRREIYKMLRDISCLVIFHNGSDYTVDLTKYGIPPNEWFVLGSNKVLWTFRGRLRLNPDLKEKVDDSHLYLYKDDTSTLGALLQEEAREIAWYTGKPCVTSEIATECCWYLLALNFKLAFHSKGGDMMDYNWAMHASNYWVCDGIIQAGQDNNEEAWDIATALHQEMRLEGYSSKRLPSFGNCMLTPRWIFLVTNPTMEQRAEINVPTVPPESTSFFLAVKIGSNPPLASLPDDMFHQSDKLRVLKLCRCTFNFTSPPFHRCRSLRFLGLDRCKDQQQQEEEKQDRPVMEIFRTIWVLDICYTDWELPSSPEIIEQMATNIRDVHIMKGRIWHINLAWRRLRNLCKLRVIEPTCPWETGDMDELTDMGKLELLDLSRNSTMIVLPSLSGATGLNTLVLDGCVGLNHIGPEGLPPFLESFSLDTKTGEDHNKIAKISRISLVGCTRLVNFRLRGSLPNLEELDLSNTSVKTLNLKDQVVKVTCLQQMILLGCEKLRSIIWPEEGMPQLRVLCVDTRGGEEVRKISAESKKLQQEYCQAFVAMKDIRLVQLLVLRNCKQFCWITDGFNLNLCISCTSKDNGQRCNKGKFGPYITGQIIGLPLQNLLIPNTYRIYADVTIDNITSDHDGSNAHLQFQPLDNHLEIGEGISYPNVESVQGIKAIIFVMGKVKSLHVHDNSSITTVIPEHMTSVEDVQIGWGHLKWCRVERCPKLHTVFPTDFYYYDCFDELETFCAADLQMAHFIWSERMAFTARKTRSLRIIHLYCCPRLVFFLRLWWDPPYIDDSYFPNLEALHIVYCGDLRQVIIPVKPKGRIPRAIGRRKGILEFPKLKHIHLHELPKLQQICEAKMSAPMLETIRVRGCWGLRRLPAVGRRHQNSRPVVDCEKDWWGKLEWDGLHVGHDPSLFDLRPSQYYKKPLPRGSVLR